MEYWEVRMLSPCGVTDHGPPAERHTDEQAAAAAAGSVGPGLNLQLSVSVLFHY